MANASRWMSLPACESVRTSRLLTLSESLAEPQSAPLSPPRPPSARRYGSRALAGQQARAEQAVVCLASAVAAVLACHWAPQSASDRACPSRKHRARAGRHPGHRARTTYPTATPPPPVRTRCLTRSDRPRHRRPWPATPAATDPPAMRSHQPGTPPSVPARVPARAILCRAVACSPAQDRHPVAAPAAPAAASQSAQAGRLARQLTSKTGSAWALHLPATSA